MVTVDGEVAWVAGVAVSEDFRLDPATERVAVLTARVAGLTSLHWWTTRQIGEILVAADDLSGASPSSAPRSAATTRAATW